MEFPALAGTAHWLAAWLFFAWVLAGPVVDGLSPMTPWLMAWLGRRSRLVQVAAVALWLGLGISVWIPQSRDADGMVPCEASIPRERIPVTDVVAVTDRGNPIRLFRTAGAAANPAAKQHREDALVGRVCKPHCRLASPDASLNCHGWTFAGQHIIRSEDVCQILDENGYKRVQSPLPGDLVVYWNAERQIVHTAIVCTVTASRVLVESKWGGLGRYQHEPSRQPYSADFDYYRSPRQGHRLQLADPTAIGLPASTTPPHPDRGLTRVGAGSMMGA